MVILKWFFDHNKLFDFNHMVHDDKKRFMKCD